MKISILCENQVSLEKADECLAEWGLSIFIKTKNINILFDTGHTDIYLHNAKHLNIDMQETDYVILSHYHSDHTGGMRYHPFKSKKKLVVHPDLIDKLPSSEASVIKSDFDVKSHQQPYDIGDGVVFLGQIPRLNDFEVGSCYNDDMTDDSAIAIKTKNGAVVIAGCSHSGICNICEYAKKVTGQKLYSVIGGFHLFDDNKNVVDKTLEYFKTEKIKYLYPMHCIDLPTLAKFYFTFKIQKLSAGNTIDLEE
jgi:7,8-dihydropterin-6-yl-methyl-4-(beta-D-ribofuranosyl)aminobenzene 5'-phosphate synthase